QLAGQPKVLRFGFELLPVGLVLVGSVEPGFNRVEHCQFLSNGEAEAVGWPCSIDLSLRRGLMFGRARCFRHRARHFVFASVILAIWRYLEIRRPRGSA